MRAAPIAALALVVAAPAAAQTSAAQNFDTDVRVQQLESQIANTRQRDVALSNELMAQEARRQADTSIATLRAQRESPGYRAPVDYDALARAPVTRGGYTSIPDDRLAASNARVRAAAENRR
jgi:hypothetical protein